MCIKNKYGVEKICIIRDLLTNAKFNSRVFKDQVNIIANGRPTPDMDKLTTKLRTCTRYFNMSHYKKFTWLTGCSSKNALFCWPCLLFGSERCIWTDSQGYRDINNLFNGTRMHEKSQCHVEATNAYKNFISSNRICRHENESGFPLGPQMCRLCLSLSDNNVSLLNVNQEQVKKWIEAKLNIKVGDRHDLPIKICWACNAFIQQWQTFMEHLQQTEAILQQFISGDSIDANLEKQSLSSKGAPKNKPSKAARVLQPGTNKKGVTHKKAVSTVSKKTLNIQSPVVAPVQKLAWDISNKPSSACQPLQTVVYKTYPPATTVNKTGIIYLQVVPVPKPFTCTNTETGQVELVVNNPIVSHEHAATKRKSDVHSEVTQKRLQLENQQDPIVQEIVLECTQVDVQNQDETKTEQSEPMQTDEIEFVDTMDIKPEQFVQDDALPDIAPDIGTDEHILTSVSCSPNMAMHVDTGQHSLDSSVINMAPANVKKTQESSSSEDLDKNLREHLSNNMITHVGCQDLGADPLELKKELIDESECALAEMKVETNNESLNESRCKERSDPLATDT